MPTSTPADPRFARIREIGGERYAEFLSSGYREHWCSGGIHATPYLLQKPVWRGDVKLFYANVWAYDFSTYDAPTPFRVAPQVQFNSHGDQRPTFNVALLDHRQTPEEVEAFFLSVYDRMQCEPYGD